MILREAILLARDASGVGILLGCSLVFIAAGIMMDAAANRRRRRPEPPEPTWDDVAAALANGCIVTEDVLPVGPMPDWLTDYPVVPFVPSHKPTTAEGMVFCAWMMQPGGVAA